MDRYITRAVRWMWRNKLTTIIGTSLVLAWISPGLLRQIVGGLFEIILGAACTALQIVFGEISRNSQTIFYIIAIVIVCIVLRNMLMSPFARKKRRK